MNFYNKSIKSSVKKGFNCLEGMAIADKKTLIASYAIRELQKNINIKEETLSFALQQIKKDLKKEYERYWIGKNNIERFEERINNLKTED